MIEKIKKCLELAKSSNPNEAALAMEKAQHLMNKYNIDMEEVKLSDINVMNTYASEAIDPAAYILDLASMIGSVFGCNTLFTREIKSSRWVTTAEFIGIKPSSDLASFAFDILRRQISKDRKKFLKLCSPRWKRPTKIRKANIFCEAWIQSVEKKVKKLVLPADKKSLITYFIKTKYGNLDTIKRRDETWKPVDHQVIKAGLNAGNSAQLNHGVNMQQQNNLT